MTFEGSYKAPDNSDALPITHRSFDNDAIMFTDTPGSTLTLRGRKSGHGVKIDFEGFKYIGVWSAANDAPFVALEPGPVTPPWTPRTTSLSTRSTPLRWRRARRTSAALASPCSRGSAVLTNGGPVDAARRPERQFVIQKARHDQKVYALLFMPSGAWGGRLLCANRPRASINFSRTCRAAGCGRISCLIVSKAK